MSLLPSTAIFEIFDKSLKPDGALVFRCKATTNQVDRDNESITLIPEVFKPAWEDFVAKGAPMLVEHGRDPEYGADVVGYFVAMTYQPETYDLNRLLIEDVPPKMEVTVTGVATDKRAIKDILVGKRQALSVGFGVPRDQDGIQKAFVYGKYLIPKQIVIFEITLCAIPVNTDCTDFTLVTDQSLIDQFGPKIGERIEAFGQEGVVTNYLLDNQQGKYLEVDFSFLKAVKIKAEEVHQKALTGDSPAAGNALVGTTYNPIEGQKQLDAKQPTFQDYPLLASLNAKQALEWKKKYGKQVRAMTPLGWARARQIANGEPISLNTVKIMASLGNFRLHSKVNPDLADRPYLDSRYVTWLAMGGEAGIDWAIQTLNKLGIAKNRLM
jgi:hypothetical protein